MHLFVAKDFSGTLNESCDEGKLEWVEKDKISSLPIWEGDKIFLDLLQTENRFFSVKLVYNGDRLAQSKIDI